MTVVEYLLKAAEYLERHDVPSARLNAELLLSSVLGVPRIDIYTGFDRPLLDAQAGEYRDLLVRRAKGCPLQYLLGDTGFMGLTLLVRPGVFIPRPETEVLVARALELLAPGARSVLDLGCGCGNVSIALAAGRPGTRVTAVDITSRAVELTRENALLCGVSDSVEALVGNLFEPVAGRRFDLVVSNPPYVPEGARDSLPAEVRDHEPPSALFAGPEGLDVIARIIREAPAFLEPDGSLALELDESHAAAVAGGMMSGWRDVELFEDLTGRPRVAVARRPEEG